MAHQVPWLVLLDRLAQHLEAHKNEKATEPDRKTRNKSFVKILQDICAVVRDAERKGSPELPEVVENAHTIINGALQYVYEEQGGFSSLATFAHSEDDPLVEDLLEHTGSDILDTFLKVYTTLVPVKSGATPKLPAFARIRPWTKSPRPHPLTARLSRFRGGFAPSATQTSPLAHTVYQARAQLTVDTLSSSPFDITVSSEGSILAMTSGAGWKARDPLLHYYLLDNQPSDFLEATSMDPGLSNVARHVATDDSRKLVFLADSDRIKSFSFAPNAAGRVPKSLPNAHTMNAQGVFDGPIVLLPNGRIARAGKGKAAIWSLDELETHQDNPGKLIGEGTCSVDYSRREDSCRDVEMSSGSAPHAIVAFADDPDYFPAVCHLHEPSKHLLCGEQAERSGGYACVSIDLEHGGERVARYLGHGGQVKKIATSRGDPNVFVTAGNDGFARLFDVRRPLPVLTFNTGLQREPCTDVVLVHPDGIPTLFTAGEVTQQVKMWDIRAEECVYELSTGNNAVTALAWDCTRSSLFVATECRYVNRLGFRTGYRGARIPRWATWKAVEKEFKAYKEAAKDGTVHAQYDGSAYGGMDYPDVYDAYLDMGEGHVNEDEVEDEVEIDEGYSADMRWPQKCFHKEDFFGYAYDAGEHVLFRWHFKDTPDITQLPASTSCD